MNTTQLKSFATEARKSLLSGVKSKMNALGFKDNGIVDERGYPMQAPDGTLFQGEIYDVSFYGKWMRLHDEIARCGFRQVCEEGAYTWFNRLMAIQILSRNGLIDPVLEFESPEVRIPLMVKQAHEGLRPDMPALDAARLNAVIDDDNRITEQFAILIVAYCQTTPILYKCFGALNDFTELLLPTNILASNGFLNLLNGTAFITDDDYHTTELIGWLYQFYISERKDEVFASFKSGHKAEASDIPAATQIFTPNWIVKYMVQNTLGRIYLDNNPDSPLKDSWQYLVEAPSGEAVIARNEAIQESPTEQPNKLKLTTIEDLTFADLSCGSGHILGEAFEVLFAIYKEEGFTRRQAIESIFTHNLTGVDIDTRARQLATFTLMLKACQQWPDAINCEVMPRVLDMPLPDDPICERYPIMKQARNLGSIMKIEPMEGETHPLVKALTDKYAAVVMNPPYMGSGNMNEQLKSYLEKNYKDGKYDLMTAFMIVCNERTKDSGKWAMINLPSWMFLSSFEPLRKSFVTNKQIHSLLHIGRGIFGADFGTVAFCISQHSPSYYGIYRKLYSQESLVRTPEEIETIFLDKKNGLYYSNQLSFLNVPGSPIAYSVSEKLLSTLKKKKISEYAISDGINNTGDNDRFIRYLWEVDKTKIGKKEKWVPLAKGGLFRKWYGNISNVIDWSKEARAFYRRSKSARIQKEYLWFRYGISWNLITISRNSFRLLPDNILYNNASPSILLKEDCIEKKEFLLGLLNSNYSQKLLKIINPTVNTNIVDIFSIPVVFKEFDEITDEVKENISISKQDWDAHETSWDFEENELVRMLKEGRATDLETAVEAYKAEWEAKFLQLHANEEELNRQFIEIYGLQDELTPEVPLEEVTILQQGEITIEK